MGDDGPPFDAWFIKRDSKASVRTHQIHMVESSFTTHWDRLLFRDYLIEHPGIADQYRLLKLDLMAKHADDRAAYGGVSCHLSIP